MENQHKKIKGYRELNQEEIDLMNKIKAKGDEILDLHDELRARLNTDLEVKEASASKSKMSENDVGSPESIELNRFKKAEPLRWAAIGKKDIQTGVMALVRAIAQPASG